jgi:hypothetical protein
LLTENEYADPQRENTGKGEKKERGISPRSRY